MTAGVVFGATIGLRPEGNGEAKRRQQEENRQKQQRR
jgi:hypothetical protein